MAENLCVKIDFGSLFDIGSFRSSKFILGNYQKIILLDVSKRCNDNPSSSCVHIKIFLPWKIFLNSTVRVVFELRRFGFGGLGIGIRNKVYMGQGFDIPNVFANR